MFITVKLINLIMFEVIMFKHCGLVVISYQWTCVIILLFYCTNLNKLGKVFLVNSLLINLICTTGENDIRIHFGFEEVIR